jgi:putative membrane protein
MAEMTAKHGGGDMKNFRTTRLAGALAIGVFGILAACAPKTDQTTDTLASTPPATATTPTTDANSGWTDANVVDVLTVANQGEVDYSQIGADKATDANVKQYAQTMVKDHGTMLDAVKSLASRLNVVPASNDKANDLKEENTKDINDLNAKTGKDFDKEFMEEQVDMHQETLDLLSDLDSRTTNADLKAAIAEAKPKVQAHLDQAKAIKDKLD